MQSKLRLLLMTLSVILLSFITNLTHAQSTATVTTDRLDYPPGDTVKISGTGFQPGETVTLQVLHVGAGDNDTSGAHAPWTAVAYSDGTISAFWVVPPDQDELGATLKLTAVGQSSGLHAEATFTDAANVNLTLSSSLSPSTYGQNVTFTVTVKNGNNAVTEGNVDFFDGSTSLNATSINLDANGQATITTSLLNAGTHTIKVVYNGTTNFKSDNKSLTQSVNAAALTVKAADQTKQYGSTASTTGVPGTTLTITGLQNTDAISSATLSYGGSPAGNLANASFGSYVITPSVAVFSSGSASNYTITYSLGNLFVSKAPLTITANNETKCQGNSFTFSGSEFSSSGLKNSETVGMVVLTSSAAAAGAAAGTYPIVPSSASGGTFTATNYSITYTNGTFTVNGNPTASISPNTAATTTICSGSSITLTGMGSGGSGSGYTYNWNSAGFGAGSTLTLGNQTSSSNNNLVVKDDLGCSSSSVSQTVTVNTITPGVIAKGAVQPGPGCANLDPGITANTSAATGSGTISYAWFQSTDGTTWVAAIGTTGGSPTGTQFNPDQFSVTTSFKRVATSTSNAVACSAESNILTYVVNPLPTVSAITGGTSVCVNSTLQLSDATPGGIWSSDDPSIASINSSGLVTGVSAGTLSLGIHYTVTDANGCSKTVNKTITVNALPTASISGGTTICSGTSASLSVSFTGAQPWSFTYNDGTNHTISSVASSSYTLAVSPTANTTYSLVSVSDAKCSNSASGSATVNVNVAPSISGQPTSVTTTYGDGDVSFSVTASGTPTPTYQWQVKNGASFVNLVGETNATLTISNPTVAISGTIYHVVISNSCSSVTSNDVSLTVQKRSVTITADAKSKTYGDADPSLSYQITDGTLAFSDAFTGSLTRDAGESVGQYNINQGTVALNSNYDLHYAGAKLTINKKTITVLLVGTVTKTYDANANATLTAANYSLPGIVGTDDVVLNNPTTGTYDNKNVGTNKNVSVSGLAISGLASGNYSLSSTTANANIGSISQRVFNVTAQAATKTYDGYVSSSVAPLYGALQGTDAITTAPIQQFDNKNWGTGKTLTPSGLVINDGNSGLNYDVHYITNTNGVINKKPINVTAQASTKIYDGNTSSNVVPSVDALAYGDSRNTPIETYDTRHVGTGKTMTPSGLTINDGNSGNNYVVTYVTSTNGEIQKKKINVTAKASVKTYDGNTSSIVVPDVDALAGDDSKNSPIETYDTPLKGTGKTMTPSGLIINDGNSGNNYDVTYVPSTNGVINALSVNTSVVTDVSTVQYSDVVTFKATITGGAPLVSGGPQAAQSVTFKVGTQVMGTANLVVDPSNSANLIATLSNIPMLEPTPYQTPPTGQMAPGSHTVTACFNSPDADFTLNTNPTSTSINLSPENAKIDYTGDVIKATATATSTTATITLRANISDITAITGDSQYDPYAGDIRNAKVKFVSRDRTTGSQDLSGWLSVTLVNSSDPKVGTVSFSWPVNLGSASSVDSVIGIVVDNGYYQRNSNDDNLVVTVYQPNGDFITGGGFITNTQSVGSLKADVGSKTNFGFNVRFNKKSTNLQGNLNFIFRSSGRSYQVKSTAMQGLGVNASNPASQTANFISKCNMTDITDPNNPISMGGNKYMYVNMIDNGDPGTKDMISFVLVDGTADPTVLGNIIYSSNWVNSKTTLMNLTGGNLVVHSGFNLSGAEQSVPNKMNIQFAPEVTEMKVFAYPNPAPTQFSVKLESSDARSPISIIVYGMNGKVMETRQNLNAGQTIYLGNNYRPGVYVLEMIQGNQRKQLKLVKQSD